MATHPYANSEQLADLLWEAEMVSDAYSGGGLILIRTSEGWRAFLGGFATEAAQDIENSLDNNVPGYDKAFGRVRRTPSLIDELHRLLPDCMCFEGYRPMKFMDDLGEY